MASGVWAPFKELSTVVNDAIAQKQPEAYYKLNDVLKKHKPDFISLLKNPVRALIVMYSVVSNLLFIRLEVLLIVLRWSKPLKMV